MFLRGADTPKHTMIFPISFQQCAKIFVDCIFQESKTDRKTVKHFYLVS